MADAKRIKTALISVYHKEGLDEIITKLHEEGVQFLSTGGTRQFIESLGFECQAVEDLTSYPSILGGRVKTLHPKIFGGILGICGIVFLIIIAPYRMSRITSFLNPWKDALGSGFQMIQSLYAIGPGGLLGLGYLHSIQKHFYLPEPQTDFIFSIIAEEFGFIGVLFVLFLNTETSE